MLIADIVPDEASRFPAVAFLRSQFPRPARGPGGLEIGSGALIAPRLILTAAHVLYDPSQGGLAEMVSVTLGGVLTRVSTQVDFPQEWRNPRSALDTSLVSPVDCGIVILPEPIDRFVTPMPFETASDSMLAGMHLSAAGFPAEPPLGCPLGTIFGAQFNLLQGASLPPDGPQYEPFRLFYPVRTVPGMSGAPVYNFDPASGVRTVRGVHTSLVPWGDGSLLASALRIDDDIYQLIRYWVDEFGRP